MITLPPSHQQISQRISGSASGSADQPADQRTSGSASGSAITGSASGSPDQPADQRISQRISGSGSPAIISPTIETARDPRTCSQCVARTPRTDPTISSCVGLGTFHSFNTCQTSSIQQENFVGKMSLLVRKSGPKPGYTKEMK